MADETYAASVEDDICGDAKIALADDDAFGDGTVADVAPAGGAACGDIGNPRVDVANCDADGTLGVAELVLIENEARGDDDVALAADDARGDADATGGAVANDGTHVQAMETEGIETNGAARGDSGIAEIVLGDGEVRGPDAMFASLRS